MTYAPEVLLVGAVIGVGVLHTIVPDHWVPITLLARQRGWSRRETAQAALKAGTGHVVSTLIIGLIVWIAGVEIATRFGNVISLASSSALIAFGGWIAIGSLREMHAEHSQDPHDGALLPDGRRRKHDSMTSHDAANDVEHARAQVLPKISSRTALLLVLGSSPMVEGIPAFFAAARFGFGLIVLMSVAFGLSTILTYVTLCVYSTVGLQRLRLGSLERYGEVISGAFIAILGCVFLVNPVL